MKTRNRRKSLVLKKKKGEINIEKQSIFTENGGSWDALEVSGIYHVTHLSKDSPVSTHVNSTLHNYLNDNGNLDKLLC